MLLVIAAVTLASLSPYPEKASNAPSEFNNLNYYNYYNHINQNFDIWKNILWHHKMKRKPLKPYSEGFIQDKGFLEMGNWYLV